ncbi:type III secretory pathway component EscT [Nakamurella sp. UYEF19]|uniref:hypothetical protein n=1 Tax=Nakamurella sp. UYEF19 TaxID=1756392 RepID=UPI003390E935
MEKVLKIVGAIVVLWIAFSIIGAVVGFVAHTVLWVALIAGGVYAVSAIAGRNRRSISNRR